MTSARSDTVYTKTAKGLLASRGGVRRRSVITLAGTVQDP